MNNHFCSLGSKLASGIPVFQPEDFVNRTDSNIHFLPVNVGYSHDLISNLKSSVNCGLDNISSSPYISSSISDILNHALETGIFPDDWKKSDEKNIPSNYRPCHRPISILRAI